ncbi:MAG: hypothetical protein WAM92_02330 [Mycobacterium sp.]
MAHSAREIQNLIYASDARPDAGNHAGIASRFRIMFVDQVGGTRHHLKW